MNEIPDHFKWQKPEDLQTERFTCGYCGHLVASDKGWRLVNNHNKWAGGVYLCSDCRRPTFIFHGQVPGTPFGRPVNHLPDEIRTVYEEARRCTANGCYTAAVLLLRKMLMNVSVEKGADEGRSFVQYVDFLAENNWVPGDGREWVAHLKDKGNEATHEIKPMGEGDAKYLVDFMEMLLRNVYELPAMLVAKASPAT